MGTSSSPDKLNAGNRCAETFFCVFSTDDVLSDLVLNRFLVV